MKQIVLIGLAAWVVLGVGCVRVMAPILEDGDLISDASLAGEWFDQSNPEQVLRISAPDAQKHYQIEYIDDKGRSGRFIGRLGRIGELMVAEVSPAELPGDWSEEYKGHFAPLVSFYIVKETAPALKFTGLETDWFEPYIKAHPEELAVSPADKDLVTSAPSEVRAFLLKHWRDPGALADVAVFIRLGVKKQPGPRPR